MQASQLRRAARFASLEGPSNSPSSAGVFVPAGSAVLAVSPTFGGFAGPAGFGVLVGSAGFAVLAGVAGPAGPN